MTTEQIRMAQLLSRCTFLPGSYDKRFAGAMSATATSSPDRELSVKQADYLNTLFYKYRKQIANADVLTRELLLTIKTGRNPNQAQLF